MQKKLARFKEAITILGLGRKIRDLGSLEHMVYLNLLKCLYVSMIREGVDLMGQKRSQNQLLCSRVLKAGPCC